MDYVCPLYMQTIRNYVLLLMIYISMHQEIAGFGCLLQKFYTWHESLAIPATCPFLSIFQQIRFNCVLAIAYNILWFANRHSRTSSLSCLLLDFEWWWMQMELHFIVYILLRMLSSFIWRILHFIQNQFDLAALKEFMENVDNQNSSIVVIRMTHIYSVCEIVNTRFSVASAILFIQWEDHWHKDKFASKMNSFQARWLDLVSQ